MKHLNIRSKMSSLVNLVPPPPPPVIHSLAPRFPLPPIGAPAHHLLVTPVPTFFDLNPTPLFDFNPSSGETKGFKPNTQGWIGMPGSPPVKAELPIFVSPKPPTVLQTSTSRSPKELVFQVGLELKCHARSSANFRKYSKIAFQSIKSQ